MYVSSAYPALPPPREIPLTVLPPQECPYLPGRIATTRAFMCSRMPTEMYQALMDAGFRRSGKMIYQPVCAGCRECRPIRVPVDRFVMSKSQRRTWRRNQDLVVTIEPPRPTQEKFDLYARYVRDWHGRAEEADAESFADFLYASPVDTLEFCYRDQAGRLLGVGICDVLAQKFLSSVYFYFDPAEHRRGVGTFAALFELNFAREHALPHYYLGYWIRDCSTMSYKSNFRPHQLLDGDGIWREYLPDVPR